MKFSNLQTKLILNGKPYLKLVFIGGFLCLVRLRFVDKMLKHGYTVFSFQKSEMTRGNILVHHKGHVPKMQVRNFEGNSIIV